MIYEKEYNSNSHSFRFAVTHAPMIERPLPRAIAGAGLLTQIIIDKYADHLPLHRQMERFKREGINIPYSTITDWVSGTVNLISTLYDALKKKILQSDYLHADETPLKVLDKDKKAKHTADIFGYITTV
jgi:transposase